MTEKIYKLLYLLLVLLLSAMSIVSIFQYLSLSSDYNVLKDKSHAQQYDLDVLNTKLESFEMYYYGKYGEKLELDYGVSGLAFPDKHIFCVYTKNRTITEVLQTSVHEYSHNELGMGHQSEIDDLQKQFQELNNSITNINR